MHIERFQGKNIEDTYGRNTVQVPFYPDYPADELKARKSDPLAYEFKQGTLARDAQASRLVTLANGDAIVLLPDTARMEYLFAYYREVYGTDHAGDHKNLRFFEGKDGFREVIPWLTMGDIRRKVVALHPFFPEYIDPSTYYIDPKIHAVVNDKAYLGELASQIPKRVVVPTRALMTNFLENDFSFPIMVKGRTGNSGDTVKEAGSYTQLGEVQKYFLDEAEETIILEEKFTHHKNFNVQMHLNSSGEITFVHASEQRVGPHGEYLGNTIQLDLEIDDLPDKVAKLAYEIAQNAYKKGYYGIVGVDILFRAGDIAEHDEVKAIDLNNRWNGSSGLNIMRQIINKLSGKKLIQSGSLYPVPGQRNVTESLSGIHPFLDKGDIFMFGGAHSRNGSKVPFKFYAGITGNTEDEIAATRRQIETLGYQVK